MIPEAIKARLGASPFRPFVLKMGSGEKFVVHRRAADRVDPRFGGQRSPSSPVGMTNRFDRVRPDTLWVI
jgi:hypothetical protein